MPRTYKKKEKSNAKWTTASLNAAVRAMANGLSQRKAQQKFGVPKTTLQNYSKQYKANNQVPDKLNIGAIPVFTADQEAEIKNHVLLLSRVFYGITCIELRRLVYDYALANNIPNKFNKNTKLAGKDWYHGFMKRNNDLSLRKPESTSLHRVIGFNRTAVSLFYTNLQALRTEFNFENHKIFNVDESGFSNVQIHQKILAKKGEHQVGKITSAERGQNVTIICCMSASGQYIPPLFVFPRARMQPALMNGAPPQSIAAVSKNGWSNSEIFLVWLNHFKQFSGCSKENKVLLVLDNHESHVNINAYQMCNDNGIIMLTIPPHTSHRLQPLDITFFGPLKKAYYQECDYFMLSNPGRRITQYEISYIFSKAYVRVCSLDKAINGFKKAGIQPFNSHVIGDEDFLPSDLLKPVDNNDTTTPDSSSQPILQLSDHGCSTHLTSSIPTASEQLGCSKSVLTEPLSIQVVNLTPVSSLLPIPKHKRGLNARQTAAKSCIVTSPEMKQILENKEDLKKKRLKKAPFSNTNRNKTSKVEKNKKVKNIACCVCQAQWGCNSEDWLKCISCENWACESCFTINKCADCEVLN